MRERDKIWADHILLFGCSADDWPTDLADAGDVVSIRRFRFLPASSTFAAAAAAAAADQIKLIAQLNQRD